MIDGAANVVQRRHRDIDRAAKHHAPHLNQHERLNSMHHALMMQLAALGHGAEREE